MLGWARSKRGYTGILNCEHHKGKESTLDRERVSHKALTVADVGLCEPSGMAA